VGVVHAALVPSRHCRGKEESALNRRGRAGYEVKIQSRMLSQRVGAWRIGDPAMTVTMATETALAEGRTTRGARLLPI
jgi:hypothetical protein